MGFLNWLGFNQPRDVPKVPEVRDDVRDLGTLFVFGKSDSGVNVDEKSAMQIATVYACVRLLAESVAQLLLHLYKVTAPDGQKKAISHPLYKILYREPNPEMTSFSYWEAVMTHLLLWGNSYSQVVMSQTTKNKIKYNLKNVHVAVLSKSDAGVYSYGTPKSLPGAVSLSLDAEGEASPFYADSVVYFRSVTNNGYSGDLEIALIPDWFREEILSETIVTGAGEALIARIKHDNL